MPTPQDLQRLSALLNQLRGIGNVQRGELIRAEDWNSLVAAVTDVAQAVLATEATPTVPAHEHVDQINLTWLSPQLREVFERGPLADPATQQRLLELEKKLQRLSDQLDEGRKSVDGFRGRLTDILTRDLEREAAVTSVRRAVENVIDPRPDLLNIRNTLGSVQREMGSVLRAASQLTVDGEVVDIGTVVNRVGQLEQLRERLRFANGELLDAASVEQRLAEVRTRSISQQQLDDAIRTRPTQVSPEVLTGIEERLGTNLRDQVNQTLEGFGSELRSEVNNRLQSVGDVVDGRLSDALPGVTQTITTTLTNSIETARTSAIDAALAGANQSLDSRERLIRNDVGAQIADVRSGVAATVRTEVGQQLPGQLAVVRTELSAVSRKVDAVAEQSGRHDDAIGQHSQALARLPQEQATLKADLRQSLLSEIDLRSANTTRAMDDRLGAVERAQSDRFRNLSDDLRKLSADTAQKIATDTASAQLRDLRTQILAEMRTVAREEVTTGVRDQVKRAVNESVQEQFATVPGLIATEVRRTGVNSPRIAGGQTIGGTK